MNQTNFEVKYGNGTTLVRPMKKLARNGHVLYVTYNAKTDTMAGLGSGFWGDMQRRFKAIRDGFTTEEEFLQFFGMNKSRMEMF